MYEEKNYETKLELLLSLYTFKDDNSSGENFASNATFHNPCTLGSTNSLWFGPFAVSLSKRSNPFLSSKCFSLK